MSKTLINGDILKNKYVFVIGSSWDKDTELLFPVLDRFGSLDNGTSLPLISIIAPHEPTEDNLQEIEDAIRSDFPHLKCIRYSSLKDFKDENIILVDCIGILMTLYKYADIAYVGGGLHTGLHNVLEPAGYGIPVLFGGWKLSDDAELLIEKGGGVAVNDRKSLYKTMFQLLKQESERIKVGSNSYSVFEKKSEASRKIANLIQENIN
jgi:3-deoxy-D-manno-octulosonic-acid transferase